jgi:hypothetical protein
MALLGNGFLIIGPLPMTYVSGAASGLGYPGNNRAMFARGDRKNQFSAFGQKAGTPNGCEPPNCWIPPNKGGAMVAYNTMNQSNTTTNSIALGKDLSASMTQDATLTPSAALSMITSMVANLQQEGQLTGPMQMTMNIAANMVQDGQIDAGLGLIAWMQAQMEQGADMSASNLRGTQSMSASIVSYSDLTAEGVRDAVWSAILANYPEAGTAGAALSAAGAAADPLLGVVEGTLTLRDVQRLVLAVLAGQVTGAGSGTETFKGQAGEDRVVSTVDTNGNRTNVTLDAA